MMMSNQEETATAKPAPTIGEAPKVGGVADLERRLAMLGDDNTPTTTNDPPPPMEVAEQSFAVPPPATKAAPMATGKNALLVSCLLGKSRRQCFFIAAALNLGKQRR